MMGQSQNQRGSSSTSPSRLSASAKPFTMKHLTNPQPNSNLSTFAPAFDPSLDNLQPVSSVAGFEPFSLVNIEQDGPTVGSYEYGGYQSAVPYDLLQKVGPEPYYPHSDLSLGFDSMTINETTQSLHAPNNHLSIGVGERGKRVDNQGSFCWIEKNDAGCETMLKEGKVSVAEELKSCDEASNGLHIKISNLTEKYNQPTSWGIEQLDAEFLSLPANQLTPSKFSTSSNLHSAALPDDDYQSQVSDHHPIVSWSNFTSGGAFFERSLSHIDSYSVKTTVPHSQEKSYGPAPVFGTSGTTGISSNNHVISENFSFGLNTTVTNNKSSGYKTCSIKELSSIPGAEGKGVNNHEDPVGKGKERIIDIPSSNEPLSASQVTNSVPQTTDSNFSDDFSLTRQGAEVCVSVEKSLDINSADLDLDSPCWIGTQNSRRSPFEVSQPVNSHPCETEVEAHNSLNPLAPHFFPCYTKPSVLQNNCIGSDFWSFQKSPTSADNLLSRAYERIDIIEGTSCSPELEVRSGIQTQCSNDVAEPHTDNALFNNSNFCTLFNSSETTEPYFVEDYFASKDEIASGKTVASTSKGLEDAANEISTCVTATATATATATECVPSTSLNGIVRTDISQTHQDLPNSLYRPSRIGGQMLVNAMSDLSELLVQNFSNDLDSLDELEHDVILRIINNLYVCIRSRDGQGTLLPESTSPGTSHCLEKFRDLQKLSNMEVQVTRRKGMTVSHGQGDHNSEQWRKSCSTIFSREIGEISGTSTGSEFCVEGVRVNQVIEKTPKDDPFREEMHAQTLLYRTLWLEAEAALCSMKYKAGLSRMKTEMERYTFRKK